VSGDPYIAVTTYGVCRPEKLTGVILTFGLPVLTWTASNTSRPHGSCSLVAGALRVTVAVLPAPLVTSDGSTVKLRYGARGHDQQQEGEYSRLDGERSERHLLVAEHAGDAHHAAVKDRESEKRKGNGGRARSGF